MPGYKSAVTTGEGKDLQYDKKTYEQISCKDVEGFALL